MLFLLGGCDLEMCTIKRLLKRCGIKYLDKNLKWGAKISDYKNEIEQLHNEKIYAVELENDLNLKNIAFIDHHNENSDKPSSLEQVAKILNHKPNLFEKAVAENDKGYIPALFKMGLTKERIEKIRALDRKCQGVTEEEEQAAKTMELKRIMYFNYEHFSPLCDRVFFERGWRKYIIYNDNQTMFYGFDIKKLKESLKKMGIEISFSGGGDYGFAGVNRKIDEKALKRIYEELKMPISTHIFMFPFVIENKKDNKFIKNIEESGKWEDDKLDFSNPESYNEFAYFYPQIRDVLYGSGDSNKERLNIAKRYKFSNGKYRIEILNGNTYELEIEKITLNIFNESIGILSFHLNNYEYSHEDILKINDFGRRIYPQFLDKDKLVEGTKGAFLADKITLELDGESIEEDFSSFGDRASLENKTPEDIETLMIPKFIKELIGRQAKIKPIIDDRMFVVSFFLDRNNKILPQLKDFSNNEYGYVNNDWWFQFVFVDGNGKTCQSKNLCPELIKKSTYDRWVDYGTLWGVSRYSFVGISNQDFLMTHTKTLYYKAMMLLLMYRAMIVYLSDRVQDIVQMVGEGKFEEVHEDSQKVYQQYLKFLNGLYFREITPQEQGIEMFNKALEIMEIQDMIKDFDREIEELDDYIKFRADKEHNEILDSLTKIGYYFLPPTFVVGFLGMNIGDFAQQGNNPLNLILALIAILLSFFFGYISIKRVSRRDEKEKENGKKKDILTTILCFFALVIILILLLLTFENHLQLQLL